MRMTAAGTVEKSWARVTAREGGLGLPLPSSGCARSHSPSKPRSEMRQENRTGQNRIESNKLFQTTHKGTNS